MGQELHACARLDSAERHSYRNTIVYVLESRFIMLMYATSFHRTGEIDAVALQKLNQPRAFLLAGMRAAESEPFRMG
jgi:hypothetical protein